jgi:Protein of unknown function (DUF1569)
MKSLFDTATYNEIETRITTLTPQSPALWGKMQVSQMLAHCKEAFKVPLSDTPIPRMFMGRLLGWMFKAQLFGEKPYKKSLPTSPAFIIKDERNFETEKLELNKLIVQFYKAGPDNVGKFPHPFFGTLSKEEWGKGMYKHLDHHLQQFGA